MKKIPVIFDTDIGGDIDDTWALAFLLRCVELDVKLITTVTTLPQYSAKLVAKLCEIAGNTYIPIGFGFPGTIEGDQAEWVIDYDLDSYPGKSTRTA